MFKKKKKQYIEIGIHNKQGDYHNTWQMTASGHIRDFKEEHKLQTTQKRRNWKR